VCVGFEGGFGPKGLENSAQALAWVTLFLRASPVRAPDNARAIHIDHIDRIQIQMTISSAPSGLVAFVVTPTQAEAWAKSSYAFCVHSSQRGRSRRYSWKATGDW